jgi:selenocysteine lyase/cysteine desulfurase
LTTVKTRFLRFLLGGLGYIFDKYASRKREDTNPSSDPVRETLLTEIPGVAVRDLGLTRCGIVSFTVAGRDADAVRAALAARAINVSVSAASSTRLDMDARGLAAVVRASVHYYNSEAELDRLAAALADGP